MKRNGTPLKAKSGLVAALDVGSTKICCLIAKPKVDRGPYGDSGPKVVGIGNLKSQGIKNGTVVDLEAAEQAIRAAVERAEQMAGDNIDKVVVNISTGKPVSKLIACEVSIGGHSISGNDLKRLLDPAALLRDTPEGRDVIHRIPVGFTVDGTRGVRDPIGMFGQTLGVNVNVVTAASGPVRNLRAVIGRCHLNVGAEMLSPLASGLACLVEDEKRMGSVCIDIGGGTTGISVFFDGEMVFADVLSVGGAHVTSDIARGLSTPFTHAERMKTLYGTCLPSSSDDGEIIQVPLVGEDDETGIVQVPRSMLVGIIRPRIEEIFDLVRGSLEAAGFLRLAGRIVLTGGGSQLTGSGEMASKIFGNHVRIAGPRPIDGLAEAVAGPAFSTAAGLLLHAVAGAEEALEGTIAASRPPEGWIGRLGHWFRENF
ncbi:MAG: cell division protein FtsA [Proteobacteria bacterium]|nr:cell division protein FtsA [Pseudomonadota bacterium]